jgi:hypothetical protein
MAIRLSTIIVGAYGMTEEARAAGVPHLRRSREQKSDWGRLLPPKFGWHAFPAEGGIGMLHKNWAYSFWIIGKHAYAPIRSGQKHATPV